MYKYSDATDSIDECIAMKHEQLVTAPKAETEVTATTEANLNSLSSIANLQLMDNLST